METPHYKPEPVEIPPPHTQQQGGQANAAGAASIKKNPSGRTPLKKSFTRSGPTTVGCIIS